MSEMSDLPPAGATRGPAPGRLARIAFALVVAAAVAMLWLAPRLPMVDLPQHAAQVAAWRDLLLGRNLFAEELRVNLATPYLVGYGLALPFAFIFDPSTALRLVLSGALVGFVAAGQGLRRELDADPRLDWLWLCGGFGFAWQWGFFTFLVAAPILLLVARLQLRHARAPTAARAATMAGAGAALLFCHGLLFLFALAIGGCLVLEIWLREGLRAAARRVWPYVAMAVALALFLAARAALDESAPSTGVAFGEPWLRPLTALVYVWSASDPWPAALLSAIALAAPWLMGLRPTRRGGVALFGAVALILAFAPDFALGTGFLQQRFALFLLPFYGLMFARAEGPASFAPAHLALVGAVCVGVAGVGARNLAFAREAQDFERILAAAEPGRRALSLIFERGSAAAANPVAYLHWPAWYGAEKGGFVDFSFAQFHPQVVRLRRDMRVAVGEQEGWRPQAFDWAQWQGQRYGYLFARGAPDEIAALRGKIPCETRAAQAGLWTLIEPVGCGAQPAR